MKRSKRLMAILLAGLMVLSCFTGCGSGKEESADKSQKEQVSAKGNELDVVRVLTKDLSKPMDSGGTYYLSDVVEGGESKIWEKLTADLAEIGIRLEVEMIPEDQYETVLQTKTVKGIDEYDMVCIEVMDEATKKTMVDNGTFVPLRSIYEEYSDGTAKDYFTTGVTGQIYNRMKNVDGENYYLLHLGITDYYGDVENVDASALKGVLIRQDWLDKLGLVMPKTTDELYDVLVEFREKDANGNGAKDELVTQGVGNASGFSGGFAQMFRLTTDIVGYNPDTGEMGSPWYQDGIKDYFTYMNKLYDAGILDLTDEFEANMAENKYGIVSDWWVTTWAEPLVTLLGEDEPPIQFVGLDVTAYPDKKTVLDNNNGALSGVDQIAITSSADKEVMGRLLDYMSTDEFKMFVNYGIEGYNYDLVDGVVVKKTGETVEQQVLAKHPNLIATTIFPRYEEYDAADEIANCQEVGKTMGYPEEGFKEKATANFNVYDNYQDYDLIYSTPEFYVGKATDEETTRYAEIITDLKTYSEELALNLILGEKSLDDWDTYIQDLKELGLDECIAIYQARYDRVK